MRTTDRIFVAGGRGLVGSALIRLLKANRYTDVHAPTSAELDLTDQAATRAFFARVRPDFVFLAAARVGGIWANDNYPADFCYTNLAIETNIIHTSYETGVRKLLFLGSSCIYPRDADIPIRESSLLQGLLEPTNEAYALAKIAGVKLCDYYRKQYGCDFITAMPTNTFGPFDNYDLRMAHMVSSLIHKFHVAKIKGDKTVTVWGTGKPRRELLYVDDVADACLLLMNQYSEPGPINVGSGVDYSIAEIAEMIKQVVGFGGNSVYDSSKPDGVFRKVMDVSRILSMGWRPKVDLVVGLTRAYEWFVEHYGDLAVHPSFKKKPLVFKTESIARPIKQMLINPLLANKSLDDPDVTKIHREIILSKPFLKSVYLDHYRDFVEQEKQLQDTPGISLELGSGGGFLKSLLPGIVTSDLHTHPGVDRVETAYKLSFKDGELRAIYMTGVFHHLGRPREFLREASRCLRRNGIIMMMEPHMSLFGKFFFRVLHHEGNDLHTLRWEFPQIGALSDANTALPDLVFDRDREVFSREFPEFEIIKRRYHTFLMYGLSGGVGFRFSAPGWSFEPISLLEKSLRPFMQKYLGTMQTIVLKKTG